MMFRYQLSSWIEGEFDTLAYVLEVVFAHFIGGGGDGGVDL